MTRMLLLIAVAGFASAAQVVDRKALTLDGAKQVLAAAEAASQPALCAASSNCNSRTHVARYADC